MRRAGVRRALGASPPVAEAAAGSPGAAQVASRDGYRFGRSGLSLREQGCCRQGLSFVYWWECCVRFQNQLSYCQETP